MTAVNETCRLARWAARFYPPLRRRFSAPGPGQAMVEFAMVAVVALMVLLIAIQYAMIGQAALAVSQAAFQAARYASVNPNSDQTAVKGYLFGSAGPPATSGVASPTISKSNGAYATFSMTPTATPRVFGQTVSVTLTFNTCSSGVLMLGKSGSTCKKFFGLSFPTSLTSTQTAMSE